jgi:hypothetical protein
VVASVLGGFCLVSYVMPDMVNTFHPKYEEQETLRRYVNAGYPENEAKSVVVQLMPQLEIARKAVFQSDAMRSLIFIGLGFAVLLMYFTNKIKKEILFAALAVFVFVDLWTVDRRYLNDKSFVSKQENQEYISGKSAADEEILKDQSLDYRVLNLTVSPFDDASTSFYHKSIGGYHGAKLRRYVDLIDFHLRPEINIFYKQINDASKNDSTLNAMFAQLRVMNMLNTKYFIIPVGEEGRAAIPLRNAQANGNAWFVKKLNVVQSADSEIVTLRRLDTKMEAVINEHFVKECKLQNTYPAEGSIKLVSYQPNDLVYEIEASGKQFAVFSEIYYAHGWQAYVDGTPQNHAQVNYVLRGMEISAGKHKVEFKFEPKTYHIGNSIALLGSILLILTIGAGLYLHRRNNVIVS